MLQTSKTTSQNYSLRHSLQNPPWSSTSIGVTTIPQALHLHIVRLPIDVLYHVLAKNTYHAQCRCVRFHLFSFILHRIIINKLLNVHHHLMQNNCPHIRARRITHCLSSLHTNQENHRKHQTIPAYIFLNYHP